jgi:RNA polymerase sigma-70 factor (ECF subfamily)
MDICQLYETHKQMVYRLALNYLKSIPDAEDVCQGVFLRLLEQRHPPQPGKEKAWLAAVTVNLCKDTLRRAKRRQTQPLTDCIPLETPEQSEIFQAVMDLNETERTAIYLHYYEGYSTREIAQILHITQTAVTTRLARARKRLKTQWEDITP